LAPSRSARNLFFSPRPMPHLSGEDTRNPSLRAPRPNMPPIAGGGTLFLFCLRQGGGPPPPPPFGFAEEYLKISADPASPVVADFDQSDPFSSGHVGRHLALMRTPACRIDRHCRRTLRSPRPSGSFLARRYHQGVFLEGDFFFPFFGLMNAEAQWASLSFCWLKSLPFTSAVTKRPTLPSFAKGLSAAAFPTLKPGLDGPPCSIA